MKDTDRLPVWGSSCEGEDWGTRCENEARYVVSYREGGIEYFASVCDSCRSYLGALASDEMEARWLRYWATR